MFVSVRTEWNKVICFQVSRFKPIVPIQERNMHILWPIHYYAMTVDTDVKKIIIIAYLHLHLSGVFWRLLKSSETKKILITFLRPLNLYWY